jgi:hypothetical protein
MSTAVVIGGISAPDSDLARKAAALAEHAHTPTSLTTSIEPTGLRNFSRKSGR